ncbi:MAG: hypothetical protein QXP04_02840 [Candidatus Nanoarchaeia archaeon]|nr:hypothetical protein [Candidatus Jingweiarchaeum tengchongense]
MKKVNKFCEIPEALALIAENLILTGFILVALGLLQVSECWNRVLPLYLSGLICTLVGLIYLIYLTKLMLVPGELGDTERNKSSSLDEEAGVMTKDGVKKGSC